MRNGLRATISLSPLGKMDLCVVICCTQSFSNIKINHYKLDVVHVGV